MRMLRTLVTGVAVLIVAAGALFATAPANAEDNVKVTICHRTNSDNNPYVQIEVDEHAVDGQSNGDHYNEHQGPVWNPTLKDQKIEWGDIIPPVAGFHEGLNWTAEGRAIYDNGCEPTTPTTESTTTTTEPPTTTTTAPTTPTTVTPPTTVPDATPTTVPDQVVTGLAQPDPVPLESLPVTGTNTVVLVATALGLLLLGTFLVKRRA